MNIIILSRNPNLYSTQSLVNACRRKNHYVKVLDHMQCDLVIEHGSPAIYYLGQKIKNVDAVIPRIGASATNFGSSVIRQFELMNIFCSLKSDPLLKARNKISCMQILAANGIRVPKSTISNNIYSVNQMIDEVGPMPIIIKLVHGTHGLGVILAEQKKTAESIVEAFHKTKQKVFLQKFIKEAGGADIRVLIVNNEIVGVMKRQAAEGEFRSNLHRGATSEIIKLNDEEMNVAKKAAKVMGLKIAGVDILQSSKGPMVLEVNASPGLEGIETTTGKDIAGKIITFVERNYQYT
ncbi:MAG: RimK family alpha-L-glutamate ligase [Saprospiraceae bacterium]